MTTMPFQQHAGVARVSTLELGQRRRDGVERPRQVATATVQGTLALDLSTTPSTTARPVLTLMPGARAELDHFARRFAGAVVEVVAGDRGVQQLLRWTSAEVYAELVRRTTAMHRTTPGDQRVRRLRAHVRSVHLFCPTPGSAELSIHVRHGQRSRAIAARLEGVEGSWRCTALEFG